MFVLKILANYKLSVTLTFHIHICHASNEHECIKQWKECTCTCIQLQWLTAFFVSKPRTSFQFATQMHFVFAKI